MPARAFSLIEVTISVGIIAICLLTLIALLPTGLNSQQAAQEESHAVTALAMVASATESLRFTSRSGSVVTWTFPNYFTDNTVRTISTGQGASTFACPLSENGLIIPNTDTTTPRRQTLVVQVLPPQNDIQPVRVYAAVAWPRKPSDNASTTTAELQDRQGFVDTIVTYAPPSSR